MTNSNGYIIAYNTIGNPKNYLAAGIDVSLSWTGRQMTGMNHPYGGWYSYEYNDEGLLTKKTGEGMTTELIYDGTHLISVKHTYYTIIYLYDDGMTPIGMLYRSSTGTEWVTYWFERNLQGDIVAVYSADGTKLLSYTYDAFGNKTTKYLATDTGHGASTNYIGYRGYYYDFDLGLYFTQTRLYDPTTGRFISADDIAYLGIGNLTSYNLFAYCGNNPVMGYDPYGTFDWSSFGKGASWLAIGITAICVGISVLTCGIAAPAMMAVATVTVTAGTLTAVNGVSEIGEATTGHNFVRDDLFGGNEKAYNIYSNTVAVVAEIGAAICSGWNAKNAPRKKAYNNIQNYKYTDTISDAAHMSRPYANSLLTQKQIIKHGKMTKDSFGYVFSAMGSVNGKEKLWRLGVNTTKELVWHWGHGF